MNNKFKFFSAPAGDELAAEINLWMEDHQKDIEIVSFSASVHPLNDLRRYVIFLLYQERGGGWWQWGLEKMGIK